MAACAGTLRASDALAREERPLTAADLAADGE